MCTLLDRKAVSTYSVDVNEIRDGSIAYSFNWRLQIGGQQESIVWSFGYILENAKMHNGSSDAMYIV